MKYLISLSLVIILSFYSGQTYAHEHHDDHDSVSVLLLSSTSKVADTIVQHEMNEYKEINAINDFPNYHPLIVHFPIVLLLVATLFQLLSFFIFKNELGWVTLILLALGVITTWLSSNTFHAHPEELSGRAKELLETHEKMADLTWWFSLIAFTGKIISRYFQMRKIGLEIIITLFIIASAATVSIAGHHGAKLVHLEGIGPRGNQLETHEQPQDDD